MDDRFDLPAELAAAYRDRRSAWTFLRRFAETWLTPIREDDGWSEDRMAAAEQRLGIRLPDAVREMYALLGRRDDLTSGNDQLLRPDQLRYDESGRLLVFRVENQACAEWGIPVDQLRLPDPPVVMRSLVAHSAPEPPRPFLRRVSLACVEMVLSECLFDDRGHHDNRETDARAVDVLERRYRPLAFPAYPLWAVPDGPPVRWYHDSDVLIRDDAREWMWVRARTPEALHAVRAMIPGDWLMAPSAEP